MSEQPPDRFRGQFGNFTPYFTDNAKEVGFRIDDTSEGRVDRDFEH